MKRRYRRIGPERDGINDIVEGISVALFAVRLMDDMWQKTDRATGERDTGTGIDFEMLVGEAEFAEAQKQTRPRTDFERRRRQVGRRRSWVAHAVAPTRLIDK